MSQDKTRATSKGIRTLPYMQLRGAVVFPFMMARFDIENGPSVAALEYAARRDICMILSAQRESVEDVPSFDEVYHVGVMVKIEQAMRMPDETFRVVFSGAERVQITSFVQREDVRWARFRVLPKMQVIDEMMCEARARICKKLFVSLAQNRGTGSPEATQAILAEEDPDLYLSMMTTHALPKVSDRQAILESESFDQALHDLMVMLSRETQLSEIEKQIQMKVQGNIDQHQKEYFLNEQLNVIHEELGENADSEAEEFRARLEKSAISGEARDKVEKELRRFNRTPPMTPESTVSRNYLEIMLALPWAVQTKDQLDTKRARKILDEDHYGLEKVKKRIIEFLAVAGIKGEMKGPILCLVGPPGVGKTSIARSVARAADRKFVRMSLGGLRDEAEIRGHRRTYIGAMPGRIITSIRQAGTMNPVFLLDEIDKMASDYRGDPASALLEALDPEQNSTFSDHYLDAPFDLSRVLFLTTANSLDSIPGPLLDRMEVLEIPGYTLQEKVQIAKRHLIPKQLDENGLTKKQLRIADSAIEQMIEGYTREAGVRSLERTIGKVCRQVAVQIQETAEEKRTCLSVTKTNLVEYLGRVRFARDDLNKAPTQGVVNGLAWTPFGGETLSVEALVMPGTGTVDLTGHLGDVMKESARAAYSYIRANGERLHIPDDFHGKHDLHIHVPEGATPKDGPSAGVAMTCAMVSAITGRKARQDIAMTGEITLSGRVLPIGGVKEKLLAAYQMGIREVLLPDGNRKDLEDIPANVRDALQVDLICRVDQAFDRVLTNSSGGSNAH